MTDHADPDSLTADDSNAPVVPFSLATVSAARWSVDESLGGTVGVWDEGDDELPICRVGGGRPDARAIAGLIAVAPELLLVCRAYLEVHREFDARPDHDFHDLARVMRRAVDKAEGRATP